MNKKNHGNELAAWLLTNQKPQAARLRLIGMLMNYMHPSTGGALTKTVTAKDFSDMLYEPPFVNDIWYS
jgi:hypothetical protein